MPATPGTTEIEKMELVVLALGCNPSMWEAEPGESRILGKLWQKVHEFPASLGYVARPCINNKGKRWKPVLYSLGWDIRKGVIKNRGWEEAACQSRRMNSFVHEEKGKKCIPESCFE